MLASNCDLFLPPLIVKGYSMLLTSLGVRNGVLSPIRYLNCISRHTEKFNEQTLLNRPMMIYESILVHLK